jgi:protein-disulfide isomerase
LAVFRKCLVGPSSGEVVKSDVALADGLQIRGTPTFMVGKRKGPGEVAVRAVLSGVTDYAAFKKVLEPLVR